MYSEHAVAALIRYATGYYYTGGDLDANLTRRVVEIGRLIGPDLGLNPTDASLGWYAAQFGTPTTPLTRAAVHVLPDGRVGFGLGPSRGVLETAGDRIVIVTHPEASRYTGAYLIPDIEYGGLI